MRYATDAVIAKAKEEIKNFEQESLMPFDVFYKLWDLTLRRGGIYNEQALTVRPHWKTSNTKRNPFRIYKEKIGKPPIKREVNRSRGKKS